MLTESTAQKPPQRDRGQQYSARKLKSNINIFELLIQTSWCAFFFSSVGAANEDTDSVSYANKWLSCMLIKGSANRGAINQRRDHSYSHPTDHGCDVMFIQLLVLSLGPRPLLLSWLSNRGAQRERTRLEIQSIHCGITHLASVYTHMFKKSKLITLSPFQTCKINNICIKCI